MSLLVFVQVIAIRRDVTIVLVDSAVSCAIYICSFSDGSGDILGISVCQKNSTCDDVDTVTVQAISFSFM